MLTVIVTALTVVMSPPLQPPLPARTPAIACPVRAQAELLHVTRSRGASCRVAVDAATHWRGRPTGCANGCGVSSEQGLMWVCIDRPLPGHRREAACAVDGWPAALRMTYRPAG